MPVNQVPPAWTFLTNHSQVLVCIARDPGVRLREIGERIGRRNQYTINTDLPMHDPIAREQNVGQLLEILTTPQRFDRQDDGRGRDASPQDPARRADR